MVECKSVEDYVDRKLSLAHSLSEAGMDPGDEWIGMSLLAGLLREYDPIKQAISNSVKVVTTDMAKNKILTEVQFNFRAEATGFSATSSPGANFARSSGSSWRRTRGGRKPNFGDKNYNNNKNSREFVNQNKRPYNNNMRCYSCNVRGHSSYEFPNNKNKNRGNFVNNHRPSSNACINDEYSDDECEEVYLSCAAYLSFMAGENTGLNDGFWIVDSGASRHMCADKSQFLNIQPYKTKSIIVANKQRIEVKGRGDIILKVENNFGPIKLRNVLYVPGLTLHLISVSCISKRNPEHEISFKSDRCLIFDPEKNVCDRAELMTNGIYRLRIRESVNVNESVNENNKCLNVNLYNNRANKCENISSNLACLPHELWYKRLAHMNFYQMSQLRKGAAHGINFPGNKELNCPECTLGKMSKRPFKASKSRAKKILELVHSDLCEVNNCLSKGGFGYTE